MANRFEIVVQAATKGFSRARKQITANLKESFDSSGRSASELASRMSSLESTSRQMDRSLRRIESFKKLKEETAKLYQEWRGAEKKAESLAEEIRNTDGSTRKLNNAFSVTSRQASRLEDRFNKKKASLENLEAALVDTGVDTRSLGDEEARLQSRLDETQAEIRKTSAAFEAAKKPTAGFFTKARTGVSTFTERLRESRRTTINWAGGLRSAFAAAAGAAGMGYLVNRSLVATEALQTMHKTTGLATDRIQELQFAADQTGVAEDRLNDALQEMSQRMGEAVADARRMGGRVTEMGEGFEAAGLSMEELARMDPTETFDRVARAIENASNEQEALNIAVKTFGDESGRSMVAMLREGDKSIQAYIDRAHELGIVLDKEMIASSTEARKKIGTLTYALRGQFRRVVGELAPAISRVASRIADWIANNKEFIRQDVPARIKQIASSVGSFVSSVGSAVKKYGKFIAGFGATSFALAIIRRLFNVTSALNAAFSAMTGTGVISWIKRYTSTAQAASVQSGVLRAAVSSVGTALTMALGALSAFIGGWQLGKVIGEIDIVERAVQRMYATIDEWFTKTKMKYLELKRAWKDLWGDGEAVKQIDRRIEAQKRHLEVIDRTREKIAAIDDSQQESVEKAVEAARKKAEAAAEEARKKAEAEAQKRQANQKTEEQEKDIYEAGQKRIKGRTDALQLALDEEIAAIDLAEAKKRITEEEAREKRIDAQREFIRDKLAMAREELEKSLSSKAEETEEKLAYEEDLKEQIRRLEIDLTNLKVEELNARTEAVKDADEEQAKSAREKYESRISMIREETNAQREELEKRISYIDDLEQEGVISHQEAVNRKIEAENEFARAKVQAAEKAAKAAAEAFGKESAEYQVAMAKQEQAAEELAEKKIEAEKRANEARKALARSFGSWVVDYTKKTIAESARTYGKYMEIMGAQWQNITGPIYGKSLRQMMQLAGQVRQVQKAFQGTADAIQDAYGVAINFENMTWDELQDAVRQVQEMFKGLLQEMRAGQADIENIGQGISDWSRNLSDVDVSMRDLSEQTSAFESAWQNLWEGGPRSVDETKAAIDRVKQSYQEMISEGEAALDALMSKWDELEGRITSIEQKIRDVYQGTEDTIRGLQQELMTAENRWLDERKQAQEAYNEAVQEMNRGNVDAANELFSEARSLAKGLAREVTNEAGETVRSLDDTTKAAVSLIRQITDAQAGNLESLKTSLEGQQASIREQIGRTQGMLEQSAGKVEQLNQQIKLSAKEINQVQQSLPASWFSADSPRNQYATGGPVSGPGHSSGGVDINAEGGEYIQPRGVVKHYGNMIFEAFRRFRVDKSAVDYLLSGGRQVMGAGGLVQQGVRAAAPQITAPPVRPRLVFGQGGQVPAAGPGVEKVYRIRFDFGQGKSYAGDFAPDAAAGVIRALEQAKVRSN